MISCSDFRLFLKRLIKDKIEKEWSENYVNDLNLVIFPRSTIKRRYENKGIDLIKLINNPSKEVMCPYCGDECLLVRDEFYKDEINGFERIVHCPKCGAWDSARISK